MVNWWFGARLFEFLGSPCERDCYLGVPLEFQSTNLPLYNFYRPMMHSSYFLVASSKPMVSWMLNTFRNSVEDVAVSFDVIFFLI